MSTERDSISALAFRHLPLTRLDAIEAAQSILTAVEMADSYRFENGSDNFAERKVRQAQTLALAFLDFAAELPREAKNATQKGQGAS